MAGVSSSLAYFLPKQREQDSKNLHQQTSSSSSTSTTGSFSHSSHISTFDSNTSSQPIIISLITDVSIHQPQEKSTVFLKFFYFFCDSFGVTNAGQRGPRTQPLCQLIFIIPPRCVLPARGSPCCARLRRFALHVDHPTRSYRQK